MMDVFKIMNISASGMTAQRFRLDIIATNIANAETTRTENGEPYRRKIPIFSEYVKMYLDHKELSGVKVEKVAVDKSPFRLVYDPTHPDADENGYVKMPNVNVLREMVDLINSQRAYEANVAVFNSVKSIANSALQIGAGG